MRGLYCLRDHNIYFYFKPQSTTRINCVPNGREMPSIGNLSIFSHPGQPIPKNVVKRRYFLETEFKQAYNYVVFNCDELRPFI